MQLKKIVQIAALLLLSAPFAASAYDSDTDYCGTPWPKWWWRWDGPRSQLEVQNWKIDSVDADFRASFELVNTGTTTFYGGMQYTVTHAAADPAGYENPAQLTAPVDARLLLGTEALAAGELPSLRPGQSVRVYTSPRAFRKDANHVLTVSFHDKDQQQFEPQPVPWYWLRVLGPSETPSALRVVQSSVTPVDSTRPGYTASRIRVVLQNTGRSIIEAGLPVLMTHGSAGSAGGNYSPDQPVDPNDPGNPYAIFFREALYEGRLERALLPGESLALDGTAFIPEAGAMIQQVTVEVGQ